MNERVIKGGTLALLSGFLLVTVLSLHPLGKPTATLMDDYFIQNGQEETGANNIVASVMFDYRGLDTLGEASVLFAAASGISIVFWRGRT
jgi:multisubunit Na+/H+ antiporter MnhB subunit